MNPSCFFSLDKVTYFGCWFGSSSCKVAAPQKSSWREKENICSDLVGRGVPRSPQITAFSGCSLEMIHPVPPYFPAPVTLCGFAQLKPEPSPAITCPFIPQSFPGYLARSRRWMDHVKTKLARLTENSPWHYAVCSTFIPSLTAPRKPVLGCWSGLHDGGHSKLHCEYPGNASHYYC